MSAVMEVAKRAVMLNPERIQLAEFARNDWVVNAQEGTAQDDVLKSEYWTHIASQMKPFDRVEVRLETGEWIMELVVLACERGWAKVKLLQKYELEEPVASMERQSEFIVKWRGPQHKHSVVRKADSAVIQAGFDSAETARMWMIDHEAKIAPGV